MRKFQSVLRIVFLVSMSVLLLSGCSVKSDRSDKPSGDWSRGLLLGRTDTKQSVALQVDADKHVHLAWCTSSANAGDALHYVHLDEQGQVLINKSLGINLPNPRKPQLLVDRENNLHLSWLSRIEDQQRLYHVLIDQNGQPTLPLLLSREGENVDSFQMYLSAAGEIAFVWSSQPETENEEKGIFHLVLHDASSPALLISRGIDPFVLVDNSGTTHLAWLYEKGLSNSDVYYATLEGSQVVPDGGQKLTNLKFAGSAVYYGPIIGADTNNIYVIWSVQNLGGGLTPTAAHAFYVSFEPGKPALTNPSSIGLPAQSMPEYADYASPYGYGKLLLLPPRVYGSDFVNAPAAVRSQESELPVALSLMVTSRSESTIQLAMVVFSEGQPIGYQLVSNTPNASVFSTLVADADSNLHGAWIDTAGFRQYDIYYASTSPEAKMWLDRTSSDDIVLGAADLVWGIISGIGLLPIVVMWNFPPLMWVILFYMFSGCEYLGRTGTKIGLLVSIIIYCASKLLLLPGLSTGTPFLYQVSSDLRASLTTAIPVTILLLALAAIYIYARRSKKATIFKAYLLFSLTDGLLTVLLYAPGFFNPR